MDPFSLLDLVDRTPVRVPLKDSLSALEDRESKEEVWLLLSGFEEKYDTYIESL